MYLCGILKKNPRYNIKMLSHEIRIKNLTQIEKLIISKIETIFGLNNAGNMFEFLHVHIFFLHKSSPHIVLYNIYSL